MKRLALMAIALMAALPLTAQKIEVTTDEECGCDLVYVDGIQTTREGNRYGFRRSDGTVIAPNRYLYVDYFHGQYCRVYIEETVCGMIDRDGNEVVPCIYQGVDYPVNGHFRVVRDGRMGYCNMRGEEVIAPQYRMAGDFGDGLAPVLVDIDSFSAAYAYIDTLGRQVLPPIYDVGLSFKEGYAVAMRYSRWGVIDRNGREVLTFMYEYMTPNNNGYFFAGDRDGMAMFNYTMKPLTPPVYTWVGDMRNGRIPVSRNGKYGFLDLQGNEVITCYYDEISIFGLNRAMVRLGDRYGIIDTTGMTILPIEYSCTTKKGRKYVYSDSLALVEKDGKLGYVDLQGNLVIPFYFEEAFQFTEGLAATKFNGQWGFIDKKGDIYLPFVFEIATPFHWGRTEVAYNGTIMEIDSRGKCTRNCNGIIAWRDWKE